MTRKLTCIVAALLIVFGAIATQPVHGAIFAGYSEYYIPGSEEQMWAVFEDLDIRIGAPILDIAQGIHTEISITVTGDNTTVYYDHWEDGYDFDPNNPDTTFDQKWVRDAGEVITLSENNIPVNPRGTSVRYDGEDRIYIAGTSATVSRTSWPESVGPVFAISWELFPVKPFLTNYTIPVGRDIAINSPFYADFERVYVLVQSVTDGNIVQIDDPTTPFVDLTTSLNRGETADLFNVNAGTTVIGTSPVQVHFIVGSDTRLRYEARGFNAMPEALWDNEYYSPVGGPPTGIPTFIFTTPIPPPSSLNMRIPPDRAVLPSRPTARFPTRTVPGASYPSIPGYTSPPTTSSGGSPRWIPSRVPMTGATPSCP